MLPCPCLLKFNTKCQELPISAALEDGMQQTTLAVKDGKAVLEPRSVSSFTPLSAINTHRQAHIAAFSGCAPRIYELDICAASKA